MTTAYRTAVAGITALGSWWMLDESTGTVVYDTGPLGHNGAITGPVTQGVTDPLAGAAVESGSTALGSGGLITVPNDPAYRLSVTPTNQWIVIADVQANTTSSTPALLELGDPASSGYAIVIDPVAKTVSYTCNGVTLTSGTIDLSSMQQLAVSWDGTHLAFWVNGVVVSTTSPGPQTVTDSSSPLTVGQAVTIIPTAGTPIEIDSGGAAVGAWAADTGTAPSSFLTAGEPGSVATVANTIDMTHPSIPAGTPMSIMQSERFAATGPVTYTVPVPAGQCTVTLFFSENYGPAQHAGGRLMNITINGTAVDSNLDTWALVGSFKAHARTYTVTTAGTLTISIANTGATGSNSPHVMAVYVLPPVAGPPTGPGVPTGLTGIAGNAQVGLSWTAPTTGGSPITSYTVTPYIGATAQTPVQVTGSPPALAATVTGLTNGTTYTFTVLATNAVGSSAESAHTGPLTPNATVTPGLLFTSIGSGLKPAAEIAAFGAPTQTFTGGNLTTLSAAAIANGKYAFNAGTYTGTWTRKSGQILWGTSSTPNSVIFDGGGTTAQALNGASTGCTIANLTVQRYNPSHLVAAVDNTTSTNCTYDYITVRNNAEEGLSVGPGSLVTNSIFSGNTNVGIGTGTVNNDPTGQPFSNLTYTVRNCEIFSNGTNSQTGPGLDAANVKVLFSNNPTFDHCYIHDSTGGFGLWFDAYCTGVTVTFCRVENSIMGGIFQELGHSASIHDNICKGNHAFSEPAFNVGAAAISISSSNNSTIYNNQVGSSGDVIIGYDGHPGVPTTNMQVHDNTVLDLPAWGPQAGQDSGTSTSHWFNNTYPVGQKFHWNGAVNLTLAQFQALGQG